MSFHYIFQKVHCWPPEKHKALQEWCGRKLITSAFVGFSKVAVFVEVVDAAARKRFGSINKIQKHMVREFPRQPFPYDPVMYKSN